MKYPSEFRFSAPENLPLTERNRALNSEMPDHVFHPVRRASDTCPMTRTPFSADHPPTSPKIHELRERKATELAAERRSWSTVPKEV